MTVRPISPWLGLPLLLLCGTLWGITFPLSKIGIEGGIHPFAYGVWVAGLSSAVLLALVFARGQRLPLGAAHLRLYLVTGLFGQALPNMAYYFYIPHMPAGLAAVIITTSPLITFVLALLLSIERFNAVRAFGVACGFSGALMLVLPGSALPSPETLGWVLLAFATPFFYAGSNIAMATLRPDALGAPAMAAGMFLASFLAQLPVLAISGEWYLLLPPTAPRDWALIAQVGCSITAHVLYLTIMPRFGLVFVSQVGYVVTLAGILWGLAFFGETLSPWVYGAAAVIMGGVVLVNLGDRLRRLKPA
ncbi:MAG TPA: DMT family transporter [Kiloniellales bacterium]|nr:DMT family transporter [Kiloniellales bacterium]